MSEVEAHSHQVGTKTGSQGKRGEQRRCHATRSLVRNRQLPHERLPRLTVVAAPQAVDWGAEAVLAAEQREAPAAGQVGEQVEVPAPVLLQLRAA